MSDTHVTSDHRAATSRATACSIQRPSPRHAPSPILVALSAI
ncbi:MAG TPA: hypothetical protein VFK02_23720 [Kofleriaceae bacterium]|nr:hypothetical protein [Kofleriaceae bacterium]